MGLTGRKTFAIAAGLCLLASIGLAAEIQFQPLGGTVTTAMDDIGEALAALVAAVACGLAARDATGRTRVGWALISISAASWGLGEVVWSIYEVGLQIAVPYPSWADAGFLLSVPFAFAGVVAFWVPGHGLIGRRRLVLDAVTVFLALMFTAWAFGLKSVYSDPEGLGEKALDLAYPVGDLLIATVLVLAIRRATRSQRGRMVLLLSGLAFNALADSAFSYLTATGTYTARGSVLDTGWVIGYLLIALSAMWPADSEPVVIERSPYDLWQLSIPWLSVLAAGGSAFVLSFTGHTLDLFLTALVGVGGSLLTVSMILAQLDSLSALRASRRSEATLAEIINEAPAGVVRVGLDLRIIDANPRFLSLLHANPEDTKGALITRFFTGSDAVSFAENLEALSSGSREAVQADGEALRTDGTKVWVHWSATAVANRTGAIDYFIAMFEDTTARHEAEAAAAASVELMQRLNTLKTEFLQSVSHEFKTALIGIQGFSEFMRDTDQLDVNDARAFAADIYRDAERLDRMVNEMLALDRAESARANVRLAPLDINAVVLREVGTAERTVGNPIVTKLAPGLPAVAGDSDRLGEVIRTLLENAIKYSPEGGKVTISTASANGLVEVGVAGEGVGVRSDFDNGLFSQNDLFANNPIRKVVGNGLALGIVRQLVQLHGGRLWVDRSAEGSIYRFTLHPADAAKAKKMPVSSGLVA